MEVITDASSEGVMCSLEVLAGIVGSSLAKSERSNWEPERGKVQVIGVSAESVVCDCGDCEGELGSESCGEGDGEGAGVGVVGGGSEMEAGGDGEGAGVVGGGGGTGTEAAGDGDGGGIGGGIGRLTWSVVPGKSKASGWTVFGEGGGVTSSQSMAVVVGDDGRTVMTGLSEGVAVWTGGRAEM